MPGRTPATSSTGAPAARAGVRGLAGHFSLPRASSATCAAVALPVAAAADGRDAAWPVADPPPDFPDSPEPQAASVQPVTSAIAKTHFCMSVRTPAFDRFVVHMDRHGAVRAGALSSRRLHQFLTRPKRSVVAGTCGRK